MIRFLTDRRALPLAAAGLCLLLLRCEALRAQQQTAVLENNHLRVEFSKENGCLVRLLNKSANVELISKAAAVQRPWALLLSPLRLVTDYNRFHLADESKAGAGKLVFEWETPYDIVVTAEAELLAESDELRLTCSAKNQGQRTILALRYPDIQGIGQLSDDGASDRLLHSTMMGAVFKDPIHLFQHDAKTLQGRGMVVSRYPNGFHGSALQLMAYYARGEGGFYVAAHDGRSTDKDLNFFKSTADSLSCEIAHFNWDARQGNSLSPGYPVVIAPLTKGAWYEAADRYRDWALRQRWCGRGTRRKRVGDNDAARWLMEDIGVVGIWWPFREDLRPAIERTRQFYGTPLLHLELWWQHEKSAAAARENGERFGPFYFPYLAQRGRDAFRAHEKDLIDPPGFSISRDWTIMCAAQKDWRRTFVESAVDMAGSGKLRHHQIWVAENRTGCDADCLYYDIGPCAGIPTHCYAEGHQHAPGAGRQITDAHVSLIRESQRQATRVKGRYVPIGTECVSEPFVGCLDFHYSRNAGFGLDMELAPYIRQLTWLPDGKMEAVPLFSYVYHEHGPLAVQGLYSADSWSSPEAMDINTWAEARAYLWGGLCSTFMLPADVEVPAGRRRFLRSLAAARMGFARDYLAYGRMQPPPEFDCREVEINHGLGPDGWLRKIRFGDRKPDISDVLDLRGDSQDNAAGDSPDDAKESELTVEQWVREALSIGATPATTEAMTVPSVVATAYTLGDRRLGLLFVNLLPAERQRIRFRVEASQFGLAKTTYQSSRKTLDDTVKQGDIATAGDISLDLPPREVVLLEFSLPADVEDQE